MNIRALLGMTWPWKNSLFFLKSGEKTLERGWPRFKAQPSFQHYNWTVLGKSSEPLFSHLPNGRKYWNRLQRFSVNIEKDNECIVNLLAQHLTNNKWTTNFSYFSVFSTPTWSWLFQSLVAQHRLWDKIPQNTITGGLTLQDKPYSSRLGWQ